MRLFLKGLVVGILVALMGTAAFSSLRYAYRMRMPAEPTRDHTLQPNPAFFVHGICRIARPKQFEWHLES